MYCGTLPHTVTYRLVTEWKLFRWSERCSLPSRPCISEIWRLLILGGHYQLAWLRVLCVHVQYQVRLGRCLLPVQFGWGFPQSESWRCPPLLLYHRALCCFDGNAPWVWLVLISVCVEFSASGLKFHSLPCWMSPPLLPVARLPPVSATPLKFFSRSPPSSD